MRAESNPPGVARIVLAVIATVLLVVSVSAFIEWRTQPPPPPNELSSR